MYTIPLNDGDDMRLKVSKHSLIVAAALTGSAIWILQR
jgi:hypothetical protein